MYNYGWDNYELKSTTKKIWEFKWMKVNFFTLSLPNLKNVFDHFEKRRNGLDVLNICGYVCFPLKVPWLMV
jgi:hypothetical protein